jgi:NADH:ubiquinone oxidoreductase subunit 4 (subunit M)
MLTALVLLPIAAAIVVALVSGRRREIHLSLGIALSVFPLALAAYLFWIFEPSAGFQYVERATWYEPWGIDWHLGVDGISLPMVVLTTLPSPSHWPLPPPSRAGSRSSSSTHCSSRQR